MSWRNVVVHCTRNLEEKRNCFDFKYHNILSATCLPRLGRIHQFDFWTSAIHKVRIKSILCLEQQTLVLYLVLSDFNKSNLALKFSPRFILDGRGDEQKCWCGYIISWILMMTVLFHKNSSCYKRRAPLLRPNFCWNGRINQYSNL